MKIVKSLGSVAATCAIGIAATTLFASAALAADESQLIVSPAPQSRIVRHVQVRYGDLDLASAAGRATIERRVRFAASDVCDGANVSNTRSAFDYLRCYGAAVDNANRQIDQRVASLQGGTVTASR